MAQGNPNFNKSLLDCCGAGITPFILCICGCECINYAVAMTTMDPNKMCCCEALKAMCCCCVCQRGMLFLINLISFHL